jgi:hypothetical protein
MNDEASIGKKTVRDVDVSGKRVLVRADLNVPLEDGAVGDDTRIRESLPTVRYLIEHGAMVILCSHLGRPKGVTPELTLAPVAARLGNLLNQEIFFATDCVGPREILEDGRFGRSRTFASTPKKRRTTLSSPASSPRWPICSSTTHSGRRIARTLPPRVSPTIFRPLPAS